MIMVKKYISLVVLVTLLFSCKQSYNDATIKFIQYLHKHHHKEILSEQLYVVIPVYACDVCIEQIVEELKSKNHDNVTIIITSLLKTEANYLLKDIDNYEVLLDMGEEIHKINLAPRMHPLLVGVENGNIIDMLEVNYATTMRESFELLELFSSDM